MRFDDKANSYEKHAFIQRDIARWGASWLDGYVEDSSVIEFGAGTGIFTRYLVDKFRRVTATDFAPKMVTEGRRLIGEAEWEVVDAWNPGDKEYDYVFSSCLLQWAPSPVENLRIWRQCLKPKGRLYNLFFIEPTLPELQSISPDVSALDWRSDVEWIGHFEEAGWRVLRQSKVSHVYRFGTATALFRMLHGLGATKSLGVNPAALRHIIRSYDEEFADRGAIESTWSFLKIECE